MLPNNNLMHENQQYFTENCNLLTGQSMPRELYRIKRQKHEIRKMTDNNQGSGREQNDYHKQVTKKLYSTFSGKNNLCCRLVFCTFAYSDLAKIKI